MRVGEGKKGDSLDARMLYVFIGGNDERGQT